MKKVMIALFFAMFTTVASAELLDQYSTQDAAYSNVRQNNADGLVIADIYEEGAGLDAKKWLRISY